MCSSRLAHGHLESGASFTAAFLCAILGIAVLAFARKLLGGQTSRDADAGVVSTALLRYPWEA